MSALDDLIDDLDDLLSDNKSSVESIGIPLTGPHLVGYNANAESAKSTATTAMLDPYFSNLDDPTEIPSGGGNTPYTDLLAACASQLKAKYDADEDRQGQLNRLYTIQQRADDAKDEVD